MMQHYLSVKDKYKDAVVFYRLGDFYEFFFEDAIEISKVLDLTLTGKDCGLENRAPMCGIPYHAADGYIEKLLSLGYKVAICEQLTEPKKGVKIVERDVVRVITGGTLVEENMLDEAKNNYIACIFEKSKKFGLSYCELSKGEFCTLEFNSEKSIEELNNFLLSISPSEIICNEGVKILFEHFTGLKNGVLPKFYPYYDWAFDEKTTNENLTKQFGKNYSKIFELENMPLSKSACGGLLNYLFETQKTTLFHINKILKINNNQFMTLDISTKRNLEIVETIRDRRKKGALLHLLDNTKTSMGARLFRSWVSAPLIDSKEINSRLDAVEELALNLILRDNLSSQLSKVRDIERIVGRIACFGLNPKHCLSLLETLKQVPTIKSLLENVKSRRLKGLFEAIDDFFEIENELEMAIDPNCSSLIKDGNFIKNGYNEELDDLRNISNKGLAWLSNLEKLEREKSGIKNLKIAYNRVYGYYFEVNKSQSHHVPLYFERKQTIANNERYTSKELKEIENKILNASEQAIKLEQKLFLKIREKLINEIPKLQILGKTLSELDCLFSLANFAVKNNYVKPKINDKIKHIKIVDGRHPVVEALLKDAQFVPNDTYLNTTTDKTMIITGPNMAGKSTYMRQVALIVLLAHIGSFVPAKEAEIEITDRIFTRIGASDDLAFGQSTFMVEMSELANILHNATQKSLIILDEIGRGTSTFDGLYIAWAVVEHLSENMQAKTLFSTHYHELTELEGFMKGVKNYRINVKEIENDIIFLRKVVRGSANKSFGIEVASIAGLPKEVIKRAKEISKDLEQADVSLKLAVPIIKKTEDVKKKTINYSQVIGVLSDIKIEQLSPLSAFEILHDLAEKVQKMNVEN